MQLCDVKVNDNKNLEQKVSREKTEKNNRGEAKLKNSINLSIITTLCCFWYLCVVILLLLL